MIRLDQLTQRYPGQREAAVDALSMDVHDGEVLVLVGPSGCGKTTTLKMINRIIEPTSGRILLDGADVTRIRGTELRRRIGYVVQQGGLFPHMTVAENIGVVPSLLGWDTERTRRRVAELLEVIGLDVDTYVNSYPQQLSGGQQQRVGVARALAADPPVLLMDEPFGAVDPVARTGLQDELRQIQAAVRKTIVFVTHDIDEAVRLGDRIAVLSDGGRIEQLATPRQLLADPASPFVARFVGSGAAIRGLGLGSVASLTLGPLDPHAARSATVRQDATLHEALDVLLTAPGHRLVVVDDDGAALGTVDVPTLLAGVDAARGVGT